jgi:hypothetical protein
MGIVVFLSPKMAFLFLNSLLANEYFIGIHYFKYGEEFISLQGLEDNKICKMDIILILLIKCLCVLFVRLQSLLISMQLPSTVFLLFLCVLTVSQ